MTLSRFFLALFSLRLDVLLGASALLGTAIGITGILSLDLALAWGDCLLRRVVGCRKRIAGFHGLELRLESDEHPTDLLANTAGIATGWNWNSLARG